MSTKQTTKTGKAPASSARKGRKEGLMALTTTPTTPRVVVDNILGARAIVESDGIVYLLTECCGASAKGAERGTVCRACHMPIRSIMGWAALASADDLTESVAQMLAELWTAQYSESLVEIARRMVVANI